MPQGDWLIIDNKYKAEQEFRRFLLENNHDGVMHVLPDADQACEEALQCLVNFLTRRYSSQLRFHEDMAVYRYKRTTDRTFETTKSYKQHPLEVTAQ